MKLKELLNQPEGRKIEFKSTLPSKADIRNKTLAPVFKKLGIIEQWGNGLQLIADEMKNYPEIALQWKEPGMAFSVSFVKKDFTEQQDSQTMTNDDERLPSEKSSEKMSEKIIHLINENSSISVAKLASILEKSTRTIERKIVVLKKEGRLKRIGPDKGGHWEVIKEEDK